MCMVIVIPGSLDAMGILLHCDDRDGLKKLAHVLSSRFGDVFDMSLVILEGALHRGCGGRYALQSETVSMRVSGMSADVTRQYFRCDKCEHHQRTIDQREAAERAAIDRIRAVHDLLTPKAIRYLREGLGLTVDQLSELCYGTPRGSIEGWEKGRYLQNREADALLRSFEFRDVLERRAAKAGVTLSQTSEPAVAAE